MAGKIVHVIRTECDVAMARSLKLLPCNNKCRSCFACILVDIDGDRAHVADIKGNFKKAE